MSVLLFGIRTFYIDGEHRFALNLGGVKDWRAVPYATFETWARKSDIPWRAIKSHLDEAMDTARNLWSDDLKNLPMNVLHKNKLIEYWGGLHKDFAI